MAAVRPRLIGEPEVAMLVAEKLDVVRACRHDAYGAERVLVLDEIGLPSMRDKIAIVRDPAVPDAFREQEIVGTDHASLQEPLEKAPCRRGLRDDVRVGIGVPDADKIGVGRAAREGVYDEAIALRGLGDLARMALERGRVHGILERLEAAYLVIDAGAYGWYMIGISRQGIHGVHMPRKRRPYIIFTVINH
jgi:hypothetical protein